MTDDTSTERTRDDLPDGRNGHVVGEKDDNVMESIGKAVVAHLKHLGADLFAGTNAGAELVVDAHAHGASVAWGRRAPAGRPDERSRGGETR